MHRCDNILFLVPHEQRNAICGPDHQTDPSPIGEKPITNGRLVEGLGDDFDLGLVDLPHVNQIQTQHTGKIL
jgi:hypothetical protein